MDSVALYDAKNRLSEICNQVAETGEPCIINRRGKPIVKLVPVDDPEDESNSVWATVEESQAKYGSLDQDFELPARSSEMRPSPLEDQRSRPRFGLRSRRPRAARRD